MAEFTVVFADLTGSTGVFEKLGNVKAVQVITSLTQWIGQVCENHGGHVVKYLGDGVLILFKESQDAIVSASELQKIHYDRIRHSPLPLKMRLQVGMARGDVVEQDGDCYGDAVNVASRLSDLSGSEQILVSESVIRQLPDSFAVRSRCLGPMIIRGRTETCTVHRVEWQDEMLSEVFTMPARLMPTSFDEPNNRPACIELSWIDLKVKFTAAELPVYLGRDIEAQFTIQDPRVSRRHAVIEWRTGKFYLKDISSYGTWVRFSDGESTIPLRRQDCVLLLDGEMALGASFEDFSVPTVAFRVKEVCDV
ncbi:adenylate/guanylate cyclase domain-containing protein [Polaromonas sp. CG_9.11]|uniref:adenylate/guanylate cyclase domain-containing protein n=1 Tax=Polaromonas sp. CG_9.11 TaxID=2787730 RepID=UPI0018CB8EBD|nr:adenylate/guanylate cyclase domain-containing protein [Polaromonas sp. CG_9.11]MBG6077941.1 class 3 adenylate cyclase [Polaromonas sp. CG_9.11]